MLADGGNAVDAAVSAVFASCTCEPTLTGPGGAGFATIHMADGTSVVLDFFAAIAFAASLGWGVTASAIAVGVYQGALTLLGVALGSVWDAAQIDAMTAVGGLLLIGISLKLLDIKHIAIGNLLPALFLAPGIVQLIVSFS